jgi:hypothetical protein
MNKNKKSKKMNILSYESNRIDYWIKNDCRTIKEKAVIMFYYNCNYEYISKKLNVKIQDVRKWIIDLYNDNYPNNTYQDRRRNKPLSIPHNFSLWNSTNIYYFWNRLKSRQTQINSKKEGK